MTGPSFNFGNVQKLEVTGEMTADYTLHDIVQDPSPVLILAPATGANKDYFNGLLRRSRKNMTKITAQNFDISLIKANRNDDRVLYSKFVVKGWKHVKDTKGKDVPFTQESVLGFLQALPDWLFDEVRNFAGNARSFLTDVIEEEEVAKN